MQVPTEPDWRTWVRMTRPAFLTLTACGVLLGLATAYACGCGFHPARAAATLVLAVAVHAAANAWNDYHDARSGADAANTSGLFPFTGGSRLIQRGEVTESQMRGLALALAALVVPAGIWLAAAAGGGLLVIGLAGLLLAWAYSAPPLALMRRGLGELTVALAWGLVVVGADYVQRSRFFAIPAVCAVSFALLVANILLINGVPDAEADARVGKRTLAVIAGPEGAAFAYLALTLLAHAWLLVAVLLLVPPQRALLGLLSLPLSLAAALLLWRRRREPSALRSAIGLTIAAAQVHALAMAVGVASIQWV